MQIARIRTPEVKKAVDLGSAFTSLLTFVSVGLGLNAPFIGATASAVLMLATRVLSARLFRDPGEGNGPREWWRCSGSARGAFYLASWCALASVACCVFAAQSSDSLSMRPIDWMPIGLCSGLLTLAYTYSGCRSRAAERQTCHPGDEAEDAS